jgi:hypothetical protein
MGHQLILMNMISQQEASQSVNVAMPTLAR